MSAPVYLDYAATTPVDPEVAAAMVECLTGEGVFGNPAAVAHAYGREAAARVEAARAQVAALIGAAPGDIVFTSGATESDNLAVLGVARACADRGRHIVSTGIEHRAVADPLARLAAEGFDVARVPVTPGAGAVLPETLRERLREDTSLVSVIHASNEVGTLQALAPLAEVAHSVGAFFHSDASQSVGKVPVDVRALGVDLLSFTAHKLYGPKGVGALYVGPQARPWVQAQILGGGHEGGLRSGTPPTHQIVGFGVAAVLASQRLAEDASRIAELRDALWEGLAAALSGVVRHGDSVHCVPGILSVGFEDVHGESLLAGVSSELAVSMGSACSSAHAEPSAVLRALGVPERLSQSTLRLSLGRGTVAADVQRAVTVVVREVARLRAAAP